MKSLTRRESEIMGYFWSNGPLFIKDLHTLYDEPKPHVNTLSTMVHILEGKGFLKHKVYGNSYQYYSVVPKEEYSKKTLSGIVSEYYDNSYLNAISALVKEEKVSVEELRELIKMIEKQK